MKKFIAFTKRTAAFFLLAAVLIGSIPPTPPPGPDAPGITEPGLKTPENPDEDGKGGQGQGNGDGAGACSDHEGEDVHEN